VWGCQTLKCSDPSDRNWTSTPKRPTLRPHSTREKTTTLRMSKRLDGFWPGWLKRRAPKASLPTLSKESQFYKGTQCVCVFQKNIICFCPKTYLPKTQFVSRFVDSVKIVFSDHASAFVLIDANMDGFLRSREVDQVSDEFMRRFAK